MFLEQLTHCLWESDWGKSTLSSKYQRTVLQSLIAASDQRGRQTGEQPLLLYLPRLLQVPLILAEVTSRGYKGPEHFPPSFFTSSSFGSQTLKIRMFKKKLYTWGKLESKWAQQGKGSERTEKTLFIPQTDPQYRNSQQ